MKTKTKQLNLFKMEDSLKVTKELSNIFKFNNEKDTQFNEIDLKEDFIILSECCSFAIEPKTDLFKSLLIPFTNKDEKRKPIILDFETKILIKDAIECGVNEYIINNRLKFNSEKMLKAYKLFKLMGIDPILTIKKDIPIKFECEYFNLILAPMVLNE